MTNSAVQSSEDYAVLAGNVDDASKATPHFAEGLPLIGLGLPPFALILAGKIAC
jgi:hypothetical protein